MVGYPYWISLAVWLFSRLWPNCSASMDKRGSKTRANVLVTIKLMRLLAIGPIGRRRTVKNATGAGTRRAAGCGRKCAVPNAAARLRIRETSPIQHARVGLIRNPEGPIVANHRRPRSFLAEGSDNDLMKAAVITRYGSPDVVQILDAPKPTPTANEVLIRVHAATVNRTDCGELRAHPFFMRLFTGLLRPKRTILGLDFAGEVEAVGAEALLFKPGDRVFGMCPSRKNGAQAEYVCVPETAAAPMAAGLSFGETVVCEGAFYANTVLERIGLKRGHTILIYGASGAIGTALVQLAKSSGAVVTAVVASRHLALAKSLGADRVVDYTSQDFTRIGATFDFVVDAVGKTSYFRCRRLLNRGATFAATDLGPWGQNVVLTLWSSITRSNRVVIPAPRRIGGFVGYLKSLMDAGHFRAIIDRTYDLGEIADAYRYVETGQKVGIVAISVVAAAEGGDV